MTEEQFYHQQINLLRLEYEKAIKPYLDRLAYLKKIEPPKAIYIEMEQASITPPQRTWVGLTDEETNKEAAKEEQAYGFVQGALWADAKLKEKNT